MKKGKTPFSSIDPEEISARRVSRRGALVLVGAALGSAAFVNSIARAEANGEDLSGCTDSDSGPNADGAGNGRGSGVSDSDTGSNADQSGCGRRRTGASTRRRCTDSDAGPNADGAGRGRSC